MHQFLTLIGGSETAAARAAAILRAIRAQPRDLVALAAFAAILTADAALIAVALGGAL